MIMQLAIYGYILIPIAFLFSILKPKSLVYLLILFLTFQTTGVFNVEKYEFSLQVYKLLIVMISIRFILEILAFKRLIFVDYKLYKIALIGAFFILYSLFMSLVLPNVFSGILVINPFRGIDSLNSSAYNVLVSLYLTFYYLVFLYIITRGWCSKEVKLVEGFFVIAFLINFIVSISQLLSYFLHFSIDITPFFYNTLQRNYAITTAYSIIPRIQGLFMEPSMFAPFLIGFISWSLYQAIEFRKKHYLFFLLLALFTVFSTTSTTAYLSLAIMVIIVLLNTNVIRFKFQSVIVDTKKLFTILFILIITVCFIVLLVLLIIGWENALEILNFVLFEKHEISSFKDRTAADIYALNLFVKTYGLGVGLGSNRPSSLVTYLLSQLGFIGTLLFSIFIVKIIFYTKSKLEDSQFMGFYFLVPSAIIAQIIAYPDLTNPTLWQFIYIETIVCIFQGIQNTYSINSKQNNNLQQIPKTES